MSKKIPEPNWDAVKKLMDDMDKHLKGNIVEVVRCKDCRWSDTYSDMSAATMPLKCLGIRYGGVYPEWYCEHGERKGEE